MIDNITIYYNTKKNADLKKAIDQLMEVKHSPYYKRGSQSEVLKMIVMPALEEELKKYGIVDS